jgi:hypothetical protein
MAEALTAPSINVEEGFLKWVRSVSAVGEPRLLQIAA